MKRTFIALELPREFKNELTELIGYFSNLSDFKLKWVEPQNLHITMQFIGDTREEDIPEISQLIATAFHDYPGLELLNPRLELIPGKMPRLLWVRFDTEDKQIRKIGRFLEDQIRQMGYQLDNKQFKFHSTIGRIKKRLPEILIREILTAELKIKRIRVSRVTFYQSILKPDGPLYNSLGEYDFIRR